MPLKTKVDVSAKEKLAKLMACENIRVEHRKVHTAMFDVKNRVLVLPIWKDISDELYSLFIGHEVSHALNTPAGEVKDAIIARDENGNVIKDDRGNEVVDRRIKSVINIVEDARIEKRIKSRFPGLRTDFFTGYSELVAKGFFDTPGKTLANDLASYNLLDRINIHFKLGTALGKLVPFTEEERQWVEKVDSCDTFSEVVDTSRQLLKYFEENYEEDFNPEDGDLEYTEGEGDGDPQEGEGGEGQGQGKGKSKGSGDEDGEGEGSGSGDGDGDGDENGEDGEGKGNKMPDFNDPNYNKSLSQTDEIIERRMAEFLDKSGLDHRYVNEPTLEQSLSTIISWKEVQKTFRRHYKRKDKQMSFAAETLEKFKIENKNIVSFLAKEFEMRKAALISNRIRVDKTGVINVNKLHSYKYNDDIFLRRATQPKGKNHGLVMFIDFSGSMGGNIDATIDQVLNLVLFCRKTQIKFRVFSFTDHNSNKKTDDLNRSMYDRYSEFDEQAVFCRNFQLREYLSNEMSGGEFREALVHLMAVRNYYKYSNYYYYHGNRSDHPNIRFTIPNTEELGGTPLNASVLAARHIVDHFRKENRLDIVHAIFLTDGEAGDGIQTVVDHRKNNAYGHHHGKVRTFLRNGKNNTTTEINDTNSWYGAESTTKTLVQRLRELCHCNVICFHLTNHPDSLIRSKVQGIKKADLEDTEAKRIKGNSLKAFLEKEYAEHNSVSVPGQGFDEYFIIPDGDELKTKNVSLDSMDKLTDNDSKVSELVKQQKSARNSRVILRRFIEKISKHVV